MKWSTDGISYARLHLRSCDVLDAAAVEEFIGEAAAELGGLDGLVNNAGRSLMAPVARTSREQWRAEFDMKIFSVLNTVRAAEPHLRRPPHRAGHHPGIPRVEAAGDVDRRDDLHQGLVVTDAIGAEALSHVRVEVDVVRRHAAPPPRRSRALRARQGLPSPGPARLPYRSRAWRPASTQRATVATRCPR